ncbi:unnamed protein product [Urochloa decumbens]|uniref:Uncharacterized protein n=1 Tax=Urochloa decumbens TaxID=240449 RepID=A0ABC8YID6_9POAL
MATIQQHHIKALTPTWFLVKVTPVTAPREGGSSKKPAACSPLLLSPAAWQRAQEQDEKNKGKDGAERGGGGLPASPRISCMGQVKGRTRRACSSARGPAPPARGSGCRGAGAGGGKVAALVLGLLSGRRNARTSRACAKVRDVPASSRGGGGRRGAGAATTALVLDPPLPVVRRPVTDENAPSLWERRRGGKALEGLQLT